MYIDYQKYRFDLDSGSLMLKDVIDSFLNRINEQKHLNVFLEVYADEALLRAKEVQEKITKGTAGTLAGMVIGIKDVLAYKNHGLEASSKILKGFKSQFTATAIQRLLDQDAIIIGRQNCDEFAMGSSNENSAFGPTLNFADNTKVPGGSSGASAVAVQAGLCHVSIGSDTGGSVRQPASFCGVYGFKPSYGRVSRWGLAAYASSFDCIGPISSNLDDLALVMEVMHGPDEYDSTAIQNKTSFLSKSEIKKYKIAYIKEISELNSLDPEVKIAYESYLASLKNNGHEIIEVSFPFLKYLLPTYYILTMAEASSNLSRYDGIRYGHRNKEASNLENIYKKTRAEGFGAEVKKRIMMGSFILSADYYDAYYTKAQKVRNLIKQKTAKILENADFILSPVSPTPAFKIGEKYEDPIQAYLADIFSVFANVVSFPALAFPVNTSKEGLPIGLQIMGDFEKDDALFEFFRK